MCSHRIENPLVPFIFDEQDLIPVNHPLIQSSEESSEEESGLPNPTALSEYKTSSLCGEGAQGTVYSALHKQDFVAIKFFSEASLPTSHKYLFAKKELEMLNAGKSLSNVLKLFGWGTDLQTDRFFIATELLRPINTVSLDPKRVQKISRGIFKGLKELHRKKIIHGDLKPENCLLNAKTEGVLADFGHASFNHEPNSYPIQSPWYRDPRVFIEAPYDHTIDLWGMGCTLFAFATNKILFPGEFYEELKEGRFYRELHVLHLIVQLIGYPPKEFILKGAEYHKFFDNTTFKLKELPKGLLFLKGRSDIHSLKRPCLKRGYTELQADRLVSLIGRLITYGDKITAEDVLQSPFFTESDDA
jgi:serine/threonine protein kinase